MRKNRGIASIVSKSRRHIDLRPGGRERREQRDRVGNGTDDMIISLIPTSFNAFLYVAAYFGSPTDPSNIPSHRTQPHVSFQSPWS